VTEAHAIESAIAIATLPAVGRVRPRVPGNVYGKGTRL
jgi:hypothetical protein